MLEFIEETKSNIICKLNVDTLYLSDQVELSKFWIRYEDFVCSDEYLPKILKVKNKIITYPHKSWIPNKSDNRIPIFMLFGNPAPHSVYYDIYFSYEGNNREHRFWKVLRELNILGISKENIKDHFLNLDYNSKFRFAFDVIYTFPSSASDKRWSGVAGLEKLFGKRAMSRINTYELKRVAETTNQFFNSRSDGKVVALQKNAFNLITNEKYDVKKALNNGLVGKFQDIDVVGIPPTRWLYTKKMQNCLTNIFN